MKRRITRLLPLILALLLASCGRADRMRSLLEQAEWMNRHDSLFTSDSIGRALVRYYDHWWQPAHLRLRAYYMLGCAYRDMGEAPAAIHYYNIATEKADTAHADSATYATLFRVYGQMAMIYEQQNMPTEEIESLDKYCYFALSAHDTLTSITAEERKVVAYYEMDDTAKVFQLTEEVCQKYLALGHPNMAASVYPTAIYACVINREYMRARRYMDIFEQKSSLFDCEGNIEHGREQYYYSKGLYYLGIEKLDSAEGYFRRLQSLGYALESREGLLQLYITQNTTDSIIKYAALAKESVVQWSDKRKADAIIQASTLYKYNRNQRIATLKTQEANNVKILCLVLSLIIVLTFIFSTLLFNHLRKRTEEYMALEDAYDHSIGEYKKLTTEYQILKSQSESSQTSNDFQRLIHEKQEMIEHLEKELGWFKDKTNVLSVLENEKIMKMEGIVNFFVSKTRPVPNWTAPTQEKWEELSELYKKYMPLSYACIINLPFQERFTCILTHLEFTPSEVAMLLNTSAQRITNVRKNANEKLSNSKKASTLLKTLRDLARGVNEV